MNYAQQANTLGATSQFQDCAVPVREPEVTAAVQRLENQIRITNESLDRLAQRLQPLMRPSVPQITGQEKQPQISTPFAQFLEDKANALQSANRGFNDLLERLEI
jgi:hypothetical protein